MNRVESGRLILPFPSGRTCFFVEMKSSFSIHMFIYLNELVDNKGQHNFW